MFIEALETREMFSATPVSAKVKVAKPKLPPTLTVAMTTPKGSTAKGSASSGASSSSSSTAKPTTVDVPGADGKIFKLNASDPLLKAKINYIAGAVAVGADDATIGKGLQLVDQGKKDEAARIAVVDGLNLPAAALKSGLDAKKLADFTADMRSIGSGDKVNDPATWTRVTNRGADAVLTENFRSKMGIPDSVEMGKGFKDVSRAYGDLASLGADVHNPGAYAAYDKFTSKGSTLDQFLASAGLPTVGGAAGAGMFGGFVTSKPANNNTGDPGSGKSDPGSSSDTHGPNSEAKDGFTDGLNNGVTDPTSRGNTNNNNSNSNNASSAPAVPGAPGDPASSSSTNTTSSTNTNSNTSSSANSGQGTNTGSSNTGSTNSTSTSSTNNNNTNSNSNNSSSGSTSNNSSSTTNQSGSSNSGSSNSGSTSSSNSQNSGSQNSGSQGSQNGGTGHGEKTGSWSYEDQEGNNVTVTTYDTGAVYTKTKHGDGSSESTYSWSDGDGNNHWHETENDSSGKMTKQRVSTDDGGYDETTYDKDGNPTGTTHHDANGYPTGSYDQDDMDRRPPPTDAQKQQMLANTGSIHTQPGVVDPNPNDDGSGYVAGAGGVMVDKKTQLLGGDRFSNTPITTRPTGSVGSVPASKGAGPEAPVGGGDDNTYVAGSGTGTAPRTPSVA